MQIALALLASLPFTTALLAQTPTPTPSAAPAAAPAAAPQAPPSTDVWLAELTHQGDVWTLSDPHDLTHRDGYDNQPFFLPSGEKLLYTSERDGQTDIYEIDLASGATIERTKTPESEYSPQPTPDGQAIAVVRVEPDGTQRLWRFPNDGSAPEPIAPALRGVGYQTWLGPNAVAVFVLGEPFTLQLVELPSGEARVVAKEIGRSIQRVPGRRAVSFTAPDGEGSAIWIYDLDDATDALVHRVAPAPASENRDYAWTPDGALVAAVGAKLFGYTPGTSTDWTEFVDLAKQGVKEITRLAVSPASDKLAFVVSR
jgi:Tol biopolymer transport system component